MKIIPRYDSKKTEVKPQKTKPVVKTIKVKKDTIEEVPAVQKIPVEDFYIKEN